MKEKWNSFLRWSQAQQLKLQIWELRDHTCLCWKLYKNGNFPLIWYLKVYRTNAITSLICRTTFFCQVSLNPVQILNQGAEEERAETARLVSAQSIFFVGNLAHFFSFAVLASPTSFAWGYSMFFFEAFFSTFLLRSLVCKSNLSHPAFTVIANLRTDWKVFRFVVSKCFLILYFQSSFVGAIAIGDLIKSTLGPKGMVKYLYYCNLLFFYCHWLSGTVCR